MNLELEKAFANFQKNCKKFAQGVMEDDGQVPMTVIFLTQNDKHEFVTVFAPQLGNIHSTQDKPYFVAAVKAAITTIKPVAVALITEAWIVKRPNLPNFDKNIRPSEEPDREEVVMVQIETFKSNAMYIYDIIRHTDNTIELEYDEEMSSDSIDKTNVDGTFSNLLRENYDKFYRHLVENINKNQN
jgi:hypothetical protein